MPKWLALVGASAAFACAAAGALATTPGTNGQIAFRRYFNAAQTVSAVFTMNADGSNVQQITHAPRGTHDDQPDWSPDGTRLALTRIPQDGPAWIVVVGADGSGERAITPRCTRKQTPARVPSGCQDAANVSFTPDGAHVTYTRATGRIKTFKKLKVNFIEHSAIVMIGADGSAPRTLLQLPAYGGDINWPHVSPDGRLIMFERSNSPLSRPQLGRALFVMNADGSGVHRVTPWKLSAGDNADWAPDSSRILFHSNEGGDVERAQFYTVRADGSGLTQLTHFPFEHRRLFSASFSPDGQQIVFARAADRTGTGDVWVMNADGSGQRPVLQSPRWDSAPDWGTRAG
jgi:TolB protein